MIRASLALAAVACALMLRAPVSATSLPQDTASLADCFIVVRPAAPLVSNAAECAHPTAPASTFKIPHALVALETGAITAQSTLDLSSTPQPYPAWRGVQTLDSAIKWSVLPFFEHTATLIGPARMVAGLKVLGYADDPFDASVPRFWITGELVVSPLEQLAFLQRLFGRSLPVAARSLSVVRDALQMPAGQITNATGAHPFVLTWPDAVVVRAKTGNTRVGDERVSWLVGAVERHGRDYVFVARRRSRGDLPNTAGAEVALRGLNALVR